ncbi:unnamed protein product [Camellia sinensis]|uniref:ADP-ribosylation factor-like protein 8a n=1 Tax=Camellia sinensis TaxID=4442 RepID=UPI0010366F97|nr:ADP-ribosylation factor-like protein 8a [Camellia sinensis]
MELSLIGLQNAGKTSLVNVIVTGGYSEDMIPTVGFNMRKVTKGNVTIKLWDLGGQPRFRSMWERYCRAVSAIVYVVDAADHDNINISRSELHDLLSKPSLSGIPLLVLGSVGESPEICLLRSQICESLSLEGTVFVICGEKKLPRAATARLPDGCPPERNEYRPKSYSSDTM